MSVTLPHKVVTLSAEERAGVGNGEVLMERESLQDDDVSIDDEADWRDSVWIVSRITWLSGTLIRVLQ